SSTRTTDVTSPTTCRRSGCALLPGWKRFSCEDKPSSPRQLWRLSGYAKVLPLLADAMMASCGRFCRQKPEEYPRYFEDFWRQKRPGVPSRLAAGLAVSAPPEVAKLLRTRLVTLMILIILPACTHRSAPPLSSAKDCSAGAGENEGGDGEGRTES